MSTIERLRAQAHWAIVHPEPRVWGDGDVTYTPLMTVDPLRVIALLDVAEAVGRMAGSGASGDQDEEPTDFWFAVNDAITALDRLDGAK
jgi:hypothetical protein